MDKLYISDNGIDFIGKVNDNFDEVQDAIEHVVANVDDNFHLFSVRDSTIYVYNGPDEDNEIGVPVSSSYGTNVFKVSAGSRLKITATNSGLKTFRYGFTNRYPQDGDAVVGGDYIANTESVDVTVTAPVDGYLCCSFGNGNFADLAVVTSVFIAEYAKQIVDGGNDDVSTSNNKSVLPIDGVIAADRNTDWTISTSNVKSCTSAMLVPYDNCLLEFTLPSDVVAYVRYGNIQSGNSTSSISSGLRNVEGFSVPSQITNICIIFDGNASDINAAISAGTIRIEYSNDTPNVVQKNIACEPAVKASMYKALENSNGSHLHNIPVFAHFSDLHGDVVRLKNLLDYCNYLGVDAILNTGDTCCNKGSDGFDTYNAIAGNQQIPVVVCVGNHDGWYPDYGGKSQNEKVYEDLLLPNATKFGYAFPTSADYNVAPTYFYKDFASQKIRVIALNQYESEGSHTDDANYWAYVGRITQKQIDWFIATLQSTPADYGVILVFHASMFPVDDITGNDKFYNRIKPSSYDSTKHLSGDPIGKIIDAFITGGSVTGSYTQTYNSSTETVNYSADFSSLNSGVEFIAHLNGHTHRDYIGLYHGTTQRQVVLSITTAQSLYGLVTHYTKANSDELPRGGQGACEDAFNIYGIDRTDGVIKIARVGANITSSFEKRDFMVIPYRAVEPTQENNLAIIVDSLPLASAQTINNIYLVSSERQETGNVYNEYVTVLVNGQYMWEKIGIAPQVIE